MDCFKHGWRHSTAPCPKCPSTRFDHVKHEIIPVVHKISLSEPHEPCWFCKLKKKLKKKRNG